MLEIVARLKLTLGNGEPLDSDDFVVVQAVEDYTFEMTMKIKEADILEMNISKILRCIQRSIMSVKCYHTIKDEKLKSMSEEEIRASPVASLDLFEDNRLRVLNVRHRDGIVKLKDNLIDLPLGNQMDALSDEEE